MSAYEAVATLVAVALAMLLVGIGVRRVKRFARLTRRAWFRSKW